MVVPLGPSVRAAVVAADANLSDRAVLLVGELTERVTVLRGPEGLGELAEERPIFLVLLGLSAAAGHGGAGAADEFDSYVRFVPRFNGNNPHGQVMLLTSGRLRLQDSLRAVASGVSAIVDWQRGDFDERVREHASAAHRYFLEQRQREEQRRLEESADGNGLVGTSRGLCKVLNQARRAARVSDAPVIIYGESGTGKQRIAEIIHRLDEKRCNKAFVSVNCAAITGTLAESELFGHKKGAFTGATEDRLGYFRSADGGTILLDEASELSLPLQPKILRVLQEGLVMPVGSDSEYDIDVRVVAATNRDMAEMVRRGQFRVDLFQRLNVIQLSVPALRERLEDIPVLFQAFLEKYEDYYRGQIKSVDPQVYEVLGKIIGSGNVRELENIVRQVLIFKECGTNIEVTDLPRHIIKNSLEPAEAAVSVSVPDETIEELVDGSRKLADVVGDYERFLLARMIERGVKQNVLADRLGITRRTLYNKLTKYNLR